MIKKLAIAALVLGVVGWLGASMTPAVQASAQEEKAREIKLTLGDPAKGEFTFSPDLIELKNGETVKLVIENKGVLPHELMSDLFQWAHDVEVEVEGVEVAASQLHEVELKPGKSAEVTFKVEVDEHIMMEKGGESGKVEFEFGCYLKDHYKNGMKGKFIVQKGD